MAWLTWRTADRLRYQGGQQQRVALARALACEPAVLFVIGDTAIAHDVAGKPLPGIAPVAKQQGAYVAEAIKACLAGKAVPLPFRYRDRGLLATVGRKTAVIAFGRLRLKGWFAWWIWGLAHIYFLISLRNRLIVMTQWLWSYVSFERGARLITGMRTKSEFYE